MRVPLRTEKKTKKESNHSETILSSLDFTIRILRKIVNKKINTQKHRESDETGRAREGRKKAVVRASLRTRSSLFVESKLNSSSMKQKILSLILFMRSII